MNENNSLGEESQEEFAHEYTKQERVKIVTNLIFIGAIISLSMHFLLIPLLAKFAQNAHNLTIFGLSGTTILLIGIFLGMPIIVGLLFIPLFKTAIKTIREKQYPPKDWKVFKKTKIIKGRKAIAKAVIILLLCSVAIIPVTILGYVSLNSILNSKNSGK